MSTLSIGDLKHGGPVLIYDSAGPGASGCSGADDHRQTVVSLTALETAASVMQVEGQGQLSTFSSPTFRPTMSGRFFSGLRPAPREDVGESPAPLESGAEAEAAAHQEIVPIKPPMSLSAAAAQIYKLTSLSSDAFFVTALSEGFMTNVYVSPSVTKQIGYTPEELFSRQVPLEACVHPDDLEKVRDIIRRGQGEEGKKHRREFIELHPFSYRRRRKDGSWADLELGGTTDGTLFYGIGRDVSADKAVEHVLKDLLTSTSFDLRLNAQTILAATSLLIKQPAVQQDEEALFLTNAVQSACSLLHGLVSNVVEMHKIEAGEVSLTRKTFSIRQMVRDILQMCRLGLAERVSDLVWDDEATPLPERVEGDLLHLQQITQNLVGNAIKFANGSLVRVSARMERAGSEDVLRLDVSDQGVGLTQEECSRVFLPFERAPASEGGGTGLGLHISRTFARALGGDVTASSAGKGRGSTFTARIPVRVIDDGSASAADSKQSVLMPSTLPDESTVEATDSTTLAPPPEADIVLRMLQELMQHASDVFLFTDPTGPASTKPVRIRFISPNVRKVLGWRPDQVIGKHCLDVLHRDDLELQKRTLNDLFRSPCSTEQCMRRFLCADGSYKWMHMDLCYDGEVVYCVARDATRHKRAEAALFDYLRCTSHDIRTPCHSISTAAQLLGALDSVHSDAEAVFLVRAISSSCETMLGVIRNVLELQNAEAVGAASRAAAATAEAAPAAPPEAPPAAPEAGEAVRLLRRAAEDDPVGTPAAQRQRTEPPSGTPAPLVRLLLAEDHLLNAKLVKRLLEGKGFVVDLAENGAVALAMLQASLGGAADAPPAPELLLSDIQMPVLDGIELIKRFRAWEAQARPGSRLPAVALTANVLDSMVQECAAAGFDGHMSKPLRADCVPELLKQLTARG